ncbi:hypothetical protein HDV05_003901 [Chytridiales sp. JEL 0842]|nr:hypothetical protein HDV05_003901 [Chytridiales sp. JEL 0842]
MRLADVVQGARTGKAGWGIKGTRHVALVSSEGKEIELEKVTPRMEWGVWAAGGMPCSRTWKTWPEVLKKRFEELKESQEKERQQQEEAPKSQTLAAEGEEGAATATDHQALSTSPSSNGSTGTLSTQASETATNLSPA